MDEGQDADCDHVVAEGGSKLTRESEVGMSSGWRFASWMKLLVATKPTLVLSMPQSWRSPVSGWRGR